MSDRNGNAFRAFVEKGLDGIMPGRRTLAAIASFAINLALVAAVAKIALTGSGDREPPRPGI